MANNDLNDAIQLIQQGQYEQAQTILQSLIQANQQDLTAWSWYVKSCRTPEKRLNALELSLRFNPGNPNIIQAIQKMREKLLEKEIFNFSPESQPLSMPVAAPTPVPVSTYQYEPSPYAMVESPPATSQPEVFSEPAKFIGLDDVSGRPFVWYDVWWMALSKFTLPMYTALLRDPLASQMRAYGWIFLSSIIVGLISLIDPSLFRLLTNLEKERGGAVSSTLIPILLILWVPIRAVLSVIGLMIGSAISNLIAKAFGGTGSYARTVYLTAAYSAPLSIISAIVDVIPIVNLLGFVLPFFSFRLHVTAIQAAHRLNGMRASLVVIIPILLVLLVSCILGVILGKYIVDLLPEIQRLQNAR